MTEPVFDQIIPADGWLAEYLIGPATTPTGRRYERVIAFMIGRIPTGSRYPAEEWKHGIDGVDCQRRLCSALPGFNRFVRLEDLEPDAQHGVRLSARPPRPKLGGPEWCGAMGDSGEAA